ncbi:MerR family transcriptional regulator [Cyanobium sp. WAJ14-Wanaka]|uniref:MerR family transcriptional regulator n=1 Tax=Cyanobium sp. WAJ14-Wanaka TaxID=2823725 RepID=UPI0020CD1532|nr:MerR family transcriptional regulator [Cyanobium sp. WAJ14-Wanaka]MCP9775003.1 MerR family transcriptional regulator [Cyanobium sp. WAJ14-Wanaka]
MASDNYSDGPALKIGQVAKNTGLSVKTIRFYCDQGLVVPSCRSEGGYRLFDQHAVADLVIIRALRSMDVPVGEIRKILDVRRSGVCNCATLKNSIQGQSASIERRVSELLVMKEELDHLLAGWQDCGGVKS